MDRAHQNAVALRFAEHHRAGTQDLAERELFQSIEVYRDPAQGVREREQLIKRWPAAVAHASELTSNALALGKCKVSTFGERPGGPGRK